jgi:hypothetical protein
MLDMSKDEHEYMLKRASATEQDDMIWQAAGMLP